MEETSTRKKEEETRLRRFRSSCPSGLSDRIHRAKSQRLYLIEKSKHLCASATGDEDSAAAAAATTTTEAAATTKEEERTVDHWKFAVLGSTGNVYTVQLGSTASCTCPDFARKQDSCKHILFVLLKVVGLDADSPLVYQSAWLQSELQDMFRRVETRGGGMPLAKEQVRARYKSMQQGDDNDEKEKEEEDPGGVKCKAVEEDDECPICYDPLLVAAAAAAAALVHCRAACGQAFHKDCLHRWLGQTRAQTCPTCRQPWHDGTNKALQNKRDEGYLNLATLQGQSTERDTSTYVSYHKRSRYY